MNGLEARGALLSPWSIVAQLLSTIAVGVGGTCSAYADSGVVREVPQAATERRMAEKVGVRDEKLRAAQSAYSGRPRSAGAVEKRKLRPVQSTMQAPRQSIDLPK